MRKHSWIIESVDGGNMGTGQFWICPECGASGGPHWEGLEVPPPTIPPFLAGTRLRVSEDCAKARSQIRQYKEKHEA